MMIDYEGMSVRSSDGLSKDMYVHEKSMMI